MYLKEKIETIKEKVEEFKLKYGHKFFVKRTNQKLCSHQNKIDITIDEDLKGKK